MGAHQNLVQRAVVLGIAVVSAGLDGAFDALVCMTVHSSFPPFVWYGISMTRKSPGKHGKEFLLIAFGTFPWYDEENQVLKLLIECSKGTYIRSIAHDLGEALGCYGHLINLQ